MDYMWIKLIAVCFYGFLQYTDLTAGQQCQDCLVHGIKFPPNEPFEYRQDCIEMTGCYCYCNGIPSCQRERNVCDRTVSSARDFYSSRRSSHSYSSSSSSESSSGLGSGQVIRSQGGNQDCNKQCYVGDTVIDGGTYFSHTNGCITYSSCHCGCDGNWQCPAQNAKNTCSDSTGTGALIGQDDTGCRSCVIDGIPYVGNSDFTYRNNCIEWSNCRCRCDGSWKCASSSGKWVCDNVCRECEVDGRKVPGKTQFRHQTACVVYDPCTCDCDGSWDCPAENGKWICTDRCLNCTVSNGQVFPGRSEFRLREDCWEWDPCLCNCDGSWGCPSENAKWVCTDQCLQCDVNGQKYEGNTLFQYVEGCYEYNCNCRCDGGWSCPANRTRDRCRLNMQTGCYYCNINDQKFEGNSLFSYEEKCIRYEKCTCNCDGSWECPGERAINICRRNETTGCNFCDVYGQQTAGNTRFELQQDCWRFDCECDCNGNWRCFDTGAQYICGSQLLDQSGCKSCLAEGKRYPGQSEFEITWGCVTFKCSCNCDGSWICNSRLAENSCSNAHFQNFLIKSITNVPNSWCSECTIGGSVYPGYSQFEYQLQCTKQYARCYCNGGYRFDSSIISGCTESSHISITKGNCIKCKMNNDFYAALSEFEISSQCKRYKCKCECNGRPVCQSVVENVCGSVLTEIRSQYEYESGGGSESVIVTGGGGGRTTVEQGTVVVSGGGTRPGGTVTRKEGTTLVVSGGSTGRETVVRQPSSSRTVVVGTGTTGTTGSRTVVVRGGGSTGSTSSRTVVVDGGAPTSSRTVVVQGGGSGGGGERRKLTETRETKYVVSSGGGGGGEGGSRTVVSSGGGGTRTVLTGSGTTGRTVVSVGQTGYSTGTVISPDGTVCYHCVGLDGKKYPGNSEFKFRRGCAVWKCQCNCNGRAICRPDDLSACLIEPQCRDCVVEGRTYRSNRMFTYEKNCILHQCRCMCDGQPRCVQTRAFDCEDERERCRECIVGRNRYQPNTMFDIESQCRRQRCQCDCSGEYRCSRAVNTCVDDRPVTTCEPCDIGGKSYQAGTTFTIDRGCYRMTCSCSCRDRLTCDQSKTVDICENPSGERCRACVVDGERYAPNSKFDRETGCYSQQCQCLCNGEHQCVSSRTYICEDRNTNANTSATSTQTQTASTSGSTSSTEERDCAKCVADRIERRIGVPFCLDRACKRYTCECYCNGRYACQTDKPENICDSEGNVIDKPCDKASVITSEETSSRTSTYTRGRGSSGITNQESASETSRTSGTTRTETSRTTVTQTETSGSASTTVYDFEERRGGVAVSTADRRGRCLTCNIQETFYDGNSDFSLQLGCKKFRCRCNCDGTWVCPRQRPENTCQQETCRNCTLRGNSYLPNTRFTLDIDRCRKYQCTCDCSGRYSCPREDIINTCQDTIRQTGQTGQCRNCEVKGNTYRGNSRFSYEEDCFRYNCDCNCDGTWNCPASRTERICEAPSTCTECDVKGKKYPGNSRFTYDEGCSRFNCICRCDGSWSCPASDTENICSDTERPGQCRECEVEGRRYRGNSRFSYDKDCFRYNCDCKCDGSWNCPASRTTRICDNPQGQCRECEVRGKRYPGNTRFFFEEDCLRYNCGCKCDGSWVCPAQRTEKICDSGTCQECTVDGRRYRGNARFSFDRGCNRYNCDCNCDGSYDCPASRTINICGGQGDNCRGCVVNGVQYQSNKQFQYDEGCFRYTCSCSCDGSFNCPASRTQRICDSEGNLLQQFATRVTNTERTRSESGGGSQTNSGYDRASSGSSRTSSRQTTGSTNSEGSKTGSSSVYESKTITETHKSSGSESVSSTSAIGGSEIVTELRSRSGYTSGSAVDSRGCRACIVNSVEYRANSNFQFDDNCFRFSCECRCNGSWNCPESRTINICPKTCTDCQVNGKVYPANTIFEYEDDCFRFNCDCRCDGKYNCPAERTKDICEGRPDKCRNCEVNGRSYPPNRSFQYDDRCFRYNCDCKCDGSWRCPASRTQNLCAGVRSNECRECYISGQRYPPNKEFSYIDGCNLKKCTCNCDGSYDCPSTTDICKSSGQICRDCLVNGKRYLPNKPFQYTDRCQRYDCDCQCNGSWNCPAERTENLCSTGKCEKCNVRGNNYPGNSVFVLTEYCRQFQCQCHCDGNWKCSKEYVRVC